MNKLIITIVSLLFVACSNKSLYESGMSSAKSQCIRDALTLEQIEQCQRNANLQPSFEEYEQKRKRRIND